MRLDKDNCPKFYYFPLTVCLIPDVTVPSENCWKVYQKKLSGDI